MPKATHGKPWESNIFDLLAKGEDSYTGTINSTNGATTIVAAPGTDNRIEVSALSFQNATASPPTCSVSLLSNTDDKWVVQMGTTVAEEHSFRFFPTLKLNENEALVLQVSATNTGIQYNLQADVYLS